MTDQNNRPHPAEAPASEWAMEVWRRAAYAYGGQSIEGSEQEVYAARIIEQAFAEREASETSDDPQDGDECTRAYTRGETAGFRRGVEAAAKYINGDGGKVIPGVVGFAQLLSGNNMPDMSGDARNRLRPHERQRFDAVMNELAARILALIETQEKG